MLNENDFSLTCEVDSSTSIRWFLTRESLRAPDERCGKCSPCRGMRKCSSLLWTFSGYSSYLVVKVLETRCESFSDEFRWYLICISRLTQECLDQWRLSVLPSLVPVLVDAERCASSSRGSPTSSLEVCSRHSVMSTWRKCFDFGKFVKLSTSVSFGVTDHWILFSVCPGPVEGATHWFPGFSDAVGFRFYRRKPWLGCVWQ